MKEDFFKVVYSMYADKGDVKRKKRTNYMFNKLLKNKFILSTGVIIIMCSTINFFLIYKFISIIEMCYRY